MNLLQLSAAVMILTALAHSTFGEKRLIAPLLGRNIDLMSGHRSKLVRFVWHYTSVLMAVTALVIVWPGTAAPLIQIIGAAWLAAGILVAVYTRGKHISWPLLSLAGLLAIWGTFT